MPVTGNGRHRSGRYARRKAADGQVLRRTVAYAVRSLRLLVCPPAVQALASSLPLGVAALIVLLLALVVVMMRFSAAMIEPPPAPAEQHIGPRPWSRARRLGALYLLLWVGIIAAFLHLGRLTGVAWDLTNLALLALVIGSWLGFNALWIILVRKLTRADAAASAGPIDLEAEDAALALAKAEELGGEEPEAQAEPEAEPPPPKPVSRLRSFLTTTGGVLVVLLFVALGEALPPVKALEGYFDAHLATARAAAVAVAGLGFALFLGGTIAMAVAGGKPPSREEAAEMQRRLFARSEGSAFWGSAFRREAALRPPAALTGTRTMNTLTLRDLRLAWGANAWQFSGRWRRIFMMAAGAVLMVLGIFGVGIVLAPAGLKLLLLCVLAYAVVRTAAGLRRP